MSEKFDKWYGIGRDVAIAGRPIGDCPVAPDEVVVAWLRGFRDYQAFEPDCRLCFGSGARRTDDAPRQHSVATIPCDCNVAAPCFIAVGAGLPDDWIASNGAAAVALERELRRELGATHRLVGANLVVGARRRGRDDVLAYPRRSIGPLFCVHLTWRAESDPAWPATDEYADVADFTTRWPAAAGEDDP